MAKKLLNKDLIQGTKVIQAKNKLFYKNGDGRSYFLVNPVSLNPRAKTTFIPECKGDNDVWDDNLGISGADCEVWVTEKWWVQNMRGEHLIKDIHAFLCKWSTAVKKYPNMVNTTDLENEGYFENINED